MGEEGPIFRALLAQDELALGAIRMVYSMLSSQKFTQSSSFGRMSNPSQADLFYLEAARVEFGNIKALQSIQLQIARGDFLFITGPSGAGKTTLLRVLSGEVALTDGKMIAPGKTTYVANIFQDLKLNGRKRCEEHLWQAFDPKIYKNKEEFSLEFKELAKAFGIHDRLHLKISEANGGLKQKVAILRSLLTKPDVLLADEPTSSLDKWNATRLFEVLSFLNSKRGMTIVWASHNKELVKQFSGKIVHLDKGKIVHSGHACFI